MHEQINFSRTEVVANKLRNIARFILREHPIPLGGPVGNVVAVAGRDPFSPNPNLPPEQLFEQARINESERIALGDQLRRTRPIF